MLQTILLPLDGSRLAETTLPHALVAARAVGGTVILANVLLTADDDVEEGTNDPLDWHLRKLEATSYLQEIEQRFLDAGISAESVLLQGDPAERIVEYALDRDVDLIMVSSHGRSGLSNWSVSGVTHKIILRAHTSVMVVPAYQAEKPTFGELRYRRLVVPLDGSKRAECALPVARALAQVHGAETWLLTVVARPEMPRNAPLAPDEVALMEKIVARNRIASEKYLTQLKSRVDDNVRTRLLVGDSVMGMLHEFLRQEGADLLILSAHGYSADSTRRYGSLATSFIAFGNTPLLIIQDLPPEELKKTDAEVAALEADKFESNSGRWTVVNAPA